jgi:hypothetical protein
MGQAFDIARADRVCDRREFEVARVTSGWRSTNSFANIRVALIVATGGTAAGLAAKAMRSPK